MLTLPTRFAIQLPMSRTRPVLTYATFAGAVRARQMLINANVAAAIPAWQADALRTELSRNCPPFGPRSPWNRPTKYEAVPLSFR
jgi:hypothetical protein